MLLQSNFDIEKRSRRESLNSGRIRTMLEGRTNAPTLFPQPF